LTLLVTHQLHYQVFSDFKEELCHRNMPFTTVNPTGLAYIVLCEELEDFSPFGRRSRNPFYVPVPLKKVDVDSKVVNFTSQVTVTQSYVNCEAAPIECTYYFPVEEEAAVVDFEAELEGRVIKTSVKEKKAAREEYQEAVSTRHTAVLLEETKQDIFEIKVGYLQPGSGCTIKMTYIMELPVEQKMTKMTIPTTVAPRYTPLSDGSEEAQKISSIKHDFNSPVMMTLNMEILMQTEITEVTSPSHKLDITEKPKQHDYFLTSAKFSGDTSMMDRDLVVFIKSDEPHQPKVLVEKDDDSYVAMMTFVPEFKLQDHKMEAIFVVDCSGSMGGQSIKLAKEALLVFIHSLPVSSYFNVILFGSSFKSLFNESRVYDDHSFEDARSSIHGVDANLGGTEILTPLKHVFKQPLKTGLARQVFVITDGQVSNSSACIELVRKHSSNNRVFSLGIGSAADRHLVKGLARAGQGTSMFTTEGEQITPKIMTQLKNALQPCITDVEVKWGKSAPFEGNGELQVEVETKKTLFGFGKPKKSTNLSVKSQVPSKVPPIYDGNRLVLYKKLDKNLDVGDEITIKAKTPEGDLEHTFSITNDSYLEGRNVHQLFARKMIQDIEERHESVMETEESKSLIVELGVKYNLASKHTSFVGVDEKQGTISTWSMNSRQVANQMPFGGMIVNKCSSLPQTLRLSLDSAAPPPGASAYSLSKSRPKKMALFGENRSKMMKNSNLIGSSAPGGGFSFGAAPQQQQRTVLHSLCTMDSASYSSDDSDYEENEDWDSPSSPGYAPTSPGSSASSSSQSPALQLTLKQNAGGSFPVDDAVAKIIGVDLSEMIAAGKGLDPRAWVTLICVSFLKMFCQDEKIIWELVSDKAEKFLTSNFPQHDKHREEAEAYLRTNQKN